MHCEITGIFIHKEGEDFKMLMLCFVIMLYVLFERLHMTVYSLLYLLPL